MPRLAVCLLTYNRLEYAKQTLESFYDNASPKPHLHIADDGSPKGYVEKLINAARKAGAPTITLSNSERGGYGRNVNLASQVTHSLADYVLMLEDDWQLTRKLDLAQFVADMEDVPELECIRMGYLSWTQPMWGKLVCGPNYKYLLLDPNSPEPHVFAGHPRLERVSFQRDVGEWPEGLDPNQTEFAVAHWHRARQGIVWPLGLDAREGYGLFAHIGTDRAR